VERLFNLLFDDLKGDSKMKKFGIFFVACALCVVAMASTAKAEVAVSGDVYAGLYNKYIFRGIDLSGNQWVSQFGADLSYKGFTLSYWSNLMTHKGGGYDAGEISETDVTLNYNFTPIELLTFNVGNTFYSLEGLRDTDELYLKTTVNTLLSPTLGIYWDCKMAKSTGLFYTFSVGHTFELVKNLGLNLGALVSYNQSNFSAQFNGIDYNNWHDYELSTGLDYSLTDNVKLSAVYTYSNALTSQARELGGVSDESLYGVKAAFSF
jgi:opacity protein-like surface antigen